MRSGIYKIQNSINGRVYIGSAAIISRRLTDHRLLLKKNKHPNCYLQASWNKHGADAFSFSTLLLCSKDDLLFFEQRAIDAFRSQGDLYNLTPVAGSMLGFKHSEETRKRLLDLPQLKAGKKLSDETRAAISRGLMGHNVSEKQRAAVVKRLTGTKMSLETRAKLSLSKFGKKQSTEHVASRMRTIKRNRELAAEVVAL